MRFPGIRAMQLMCSMRILCGLLASVVAFALSPPSAWANWQYTQWDMSPDEVIAASNGQAVPTTASERARMRIAYTGQNALLRAPYSFAPDLDATAYFYFTEGNKLERVNLAMNIDVPDSQKRQTVETKIKALHERFDREYGPADNKPAIAVMRASGWYDEDNGEQITLTTLFNSEISVDYYAPVTPARIGDVSGARRVWVELCDPKQAGRVEQDWRDFLSHAPADRMRGQAESAYAAAAVRTRGLAADSTYMRRICTSGAIDVSGWEERFSTFDWGRPNQ